MISRERLRQADKHAMRRWRAFHPYLWAELGPGRFGVSHSATVSNVPGEWQRYRKLTKPCSGPCCGNPRRHFGQVTIQEQRAGNYADGD